MDDRPGQFGVVDIAEADACIEGDGTGPLCRAEAGGSGAQGDRRRTIHRLDRQGARCCARGGTNRIGIGIHHTPTDGAIGRHTVGGELGITAGEGHGAQGLLIGRHLGDAREG